MKKILLFIMFLSVLTLSGCKTLKLERALGALEKENYTVDGSNANSLKGGEIDTAIQSFNAIDIDWNGAQLGTTTINTTGKLLSY